MTKPKDRTPKDADRVAGPLPRSPARTGAKPERAFDVWLNRGLHELYDKVAREPIPDGLLKLIEDDRKS